MLKFFVVIWNALRNNAEHLFNVAKDFLQRTLNSNVSKEITDEVIQEVTVTEETTKK